jgi:hypothetical protein
MSEREWKIGGIMLAGGKKYWDKTNLFLVLIFNHEFHTD